MHIAYSYCTPEPLYSSRADVSGAALFYLLWLPPRFPALFRYVWLAAALLLLLLALAARSAWRDRRRLTHLCSAFCCGFYSPLARLSSARGWGWTQLHVRLPHHRRTRS